MTNQTAELLAPAGNPEALDAAVGEGADAVYLGLKNFNARLRSGNFAYSQFEAAVEALHGMGKKLYVTVNTVFEQREADRMYQLLQYLEKVGPDGIIVQDLGVVKMVRDHFPGLRLHASTQMNVGSAAGANVLSRHGFKRVVLSRELSLAEIQGVREGTNLELETFVHGALCVSASGLCLFSSYLGGRSANRGACTQACRRLFREEERDGYFFSPDDLQLVERVPDLVDAGVSSLKIEGRMKSAEYVGAVVAAYRYMLDNWRFDRERAASKALAMLQGDFARRKTTFWFDGSVDMDFIRPDQAGGTGIALGKVKVVRVFDEKRWMLVRGYPGIAEGDSIRIHAHDDSGRATARVRGVMEKPEGLFLQVDAEYGPEDEIYLVQTKTMTRRYKPVLPSSLGRFHRFPSYDAAPKPEFPALSRERLSALPDGLYAMVDRVEDLHTVLADRPEKAVLRLDRKNAALLRKHWKENPFKRDSLVLWLEPFFPQGDAEWLAAELDHWTAEGQKIFIANNLGHLALLKGRDVTVIAGPWMYAFNAWSAAFLLADGVDCLVPPYEISKQDFGRATEFLPEKALMAVAFAYPPLFTIRADLGKKYDMRFFRDREDEDYELVTRETGSTVVSVKPFSLVDRIPFLRREGVGKFLLDFSYVELRKQVYKRVMSAAREGTPLPETGRFNWKDGFWNPEEDAVGARSPRRADSGESTGPAAAPASRATQGTTSRRTAGPRTGDDAAATARREAAVVRARKAAGRPGRGGRPQWFEKDGASDAAPSAGRRGTGQPGRAAKADRGAGSEKTARAGRTGRGASPGKPDGAERPAKPARTTRKPAAGSASKWSSSADAKAGRKPGGKPRSPGRSRS